MGVMEKGPSNTSIEDAFSREGFFFYQKYENELQS